MSGVEPESAAVPLRVLQRRDTLHPLLAGIAVQQVHRIHRHRVAVDIVVIHRPIRPRYSVHA